MCVFMQNSSVSLQGTLNLTVFPKTAFFYLFHLTNLKHRSRNWVIASDADLLYLPRVHCSKGKTSNASIQAQWHGVSHRPGLSPGVQRSWGQNHKPQQQHLAMQMVGLSLPWEIKHFLCPMVQLTVFFGSLNLLQKSGPSSSSGLWPFCHQEEGLVQEAKGGSRQLPTSGIFN